MNVFGEIIIFGSLKDFELFFEVFFNIFFSARSAELKKCQTLKNTILKPLMFAVWDKQVAKLKDIGPTDNITDLRRHEEVPVSQ